MTRKTSSSLVYFRAPSGEGMVVLPVALLKELDDLADLEDEILAAKAAWERMQTARAHDDFVYPESVLLRLESGEHPLKVWREHRGLTQKQLANIVGVAPGHISHLETGHRRPGRKLIARLAAALQVPEEILLEDLLADANAA